jgi:hypothetical protein
MKKQRLCSPTLDLTLKLLGSAHPDRDGADMEGGGRMLDRSCGACTECAYVLPGVDQRNALWSS